jgi:non-ribosomal peptide synthetase component F
MDDGSRPENIQIADNRRVREAYKCQQAGERLRDMTASNDEMQAARRFDGVRVDYPLGEDVWAYLTYFARSTPGAVACIWDGGNLTYAELFRLADAWAGRFAAAGVREGEAVAVEIPRGALLVVVLAALTKVGSPYIALDLRWPEARRHEASRAARCTYSISSAEIEPTSLAVDIAALSTSAPELFAPEVLCFFVTSGSSGRPKIVPAPARGVLRIAFDPGLHFSAGTRMLQLAPSPWDAFALELWCPLVRGGATVIHDDPLPTGASIDFFLTHSRVNTLFLTTALFNALVDECLEIFEGVEIVMCGGEQASPRHIARFSAAYQDIILLHVYGPVECSIFATSHRVRGGFDNDEVPIGRPVANTTVLLVPAASNGSRPPSELEIVLAGDGLASGYVGDPEVTRRHFMAGVKVADTELACYRTGDLAKVTAEGDLLFAGRKDEQLKINGVRIEPGEIKAFAESMPEIVRAVVVGVPVGKPNKTGTVLFYALRHGTFLTREELKRRFAEHFPYNFIPLVFVHVDDIPLSDTGKTPVAWFRRMLAQLDAAPVITRGLMANDELRLKLEQMAVSALENVSRE